jgi:hypothetical protein
LFRELFRELLFRELFRELFRVLFRELFRELLFRELLFRELLFRVLCEDFKSMFTRTGEFLNDMPFGFDMLFPVIAPVSSENPEGFITRSKLSSMNAICSSLILGCP